MLYILRHQCRSLPVHHELLRLLQEIVQAILDVAGEQIGGSGAERVERKCRVDLLWKAC
jgi:hypothetical protein